MQKMRIPSTVLSWVPGNLHVSVHVMLTFGNKTDFKNLSPSHVSLPQIAFSAGTFQWFVLNGLNNSFCRDGTSGVSAPLLYTGFAFMINCMWTDLGYKSLWVFFLLSYILAWIIYPVCAALLVALAHEWVWAAEEGRMKEGLLKLVCCLWKSSSRPTSKSGNPNSSVTAEGRS